MQIVKKISEATGAPQKTVLQGMLGLVIMFIVFGVGSSLLTNVIGVAYPAFMSFVALESEGTDDDQMWLTYWVCFGCFSILDQFAGILLRLIPFYYVLKVAFLVWLFHPSSQGALTIYKSFILPFVEQYGGHIESFEKSVEQKYNETTSYVKSTAKNVTGDKKEE